MPDRFGDLTARLGLSPTLLIQGKSSQNVNRDRIADVLEETITRLGLGDQPRLKRQQQFDVAHATVERLVAVEALDDAEHMSKAANPDWADSLKMVRLRIGSLVRRGDFARLEVEIARQEMRIKDALRTRDFLETFRSDPAAKALLDKASFARLSTRLGLTPALLLEGEVPKGVSRERIAESIEMILASRKIAADQPLDERQRSEVIHATVAHLFKIEAYEDGDFLSHAANSRWEDTADMVRMRLTGLSRRVVSRMGEYLPLAAEVDRQLARADLDEQQWEFLRRFVNDPLIYSCLPNLFIYHDRLWGKLETDLHKKIESFLRHPERLIPLPPRLEKNLVSVCCADTGDQEAFIRDLRFGKTVQLYCSFLKNCLEDHSESFDEIADPFIMRDEDAALVRNLLSQTSDLFRMKSADLLERTVAGGQSILLSAAHAGVSIAFVLPKLDAKLPMTVIRSAPSPADNRVEAGRDFLISAWGPDTAREFLKLMKIVRKEQRLVAIVPDGAHGETEFHEINGRKIPIGKGAARIAHMSKAATFFMHSTWNGQWFDLELVQGPTALPGSDAEAFTQEFNSFYAEQCAKILNGPPVDMAPNGGFWNAFS